MLFVLSVSPKRKNTSPGLKIKTPSAQNPAGRAEQCHPTNSHKFHTTIVHRPSHTPPFPQNKIKLNCHIHTLDSRIFHPFQRCPNQFVDPYATAH